MKKKNVNETNFQYMPVLMSVGISVGMLMGAVFKNMPLFMSIGLSIGLCIGVIIDTKCSKRNKK